MPYLKQGELEKQKFDISPNLYIRFGIITIEKRVSIKFNKNWSLKKRVTIDNDNLFLVELDCDSLDSNTGINEISLLIYRDSFHLELNYDR